MKVMSYTRFSVWVCVNGASLLSKTHGCTDMYQRDVLIPLSPSPPLFQEKTLDVWLKIRVAFLFLKITSCLNHDV